MANKKENKISLSLVLLFIGGLLLFIRFLITEIPSPSNDIFTFLINLFIAIVVIVFYFIFLFGIKNYSLTLRAFAPSILILILFGKESVNFINNTVTGIFSIINNLMFLLMILTGFVLMFIRNKVLGYVFFISCVTYSIILVASLMTLAIADAVNGNPFNVTSFLSSLLIAISSTLLGTGIYLKIKNKSLLDF